jgi:hypothetical protein
MPTTSRRIFRQMPSLIYADAARACEDILQGIQPLEVRTILFTREDDVVPSNWNAGLIWVAVPNVHVTREGQVKLGLLICFARGILKPGVRVVFLTGIAKSKSIDTVMVLDLDTESELLSIHKQYFFAMDTSERRSLNGLSRWPPPWRPRGERGIRSVQSLC